MKKSKYARIIILVLSLALLIGSVIAISASAEETEAKGTFGGISVVYTDKVALRVIVNATPDEITGGKVAVTYELNGEKKNASYYKTDGDGNVWVITEGIAAYDLTQVVTFSSTVDGAPVEENRTCSVVQFIYAMLYTNDELTDEYKNLYNTLLAYGEAAQIAFNKNLDNLATKATIVSTNNADITVNGGKYAFTTAASLEVTPVYTKEIPAGSEHLGWNIIDDGVAKKADLTFTAAGVVEIVSPVIHTHDDTNNDHICDVDDCDEVISDHTFTDGVCKCGLIANVLENKPIVPSTDTATNIYSSSFGYGKMNDGDLASRYSSKQNSGKVEATIDLGAVYDLSEFRFLLYAYGGSGFNQFGTGVEIQVLFNGEWTTVVEASPEDFVVVKTGDQNWLTFDLGGATARQVKFIIPEHGSEGWTTFWELECSGKVSTAVETTPVLYENVLGGKKFVPTDDAAASVLTESWWKGGGYETLTDGIKNADNAPGRFSTVMATTGMMDATVDLFGTYELQTLKIFTYDPAAGTGAGSVGANLLIQVYANGEWTDVVTCADNAAVMANLVVNEGTYNDYLEFDLGGIEAEKVKIRISASASGSGTTFEEIECSGYAK